jgi:hypothetical protein
MNMASAWIISNAKLDCNIATGSSRRSKWRYHFHTSEFDWERCAQDKTTPLISCGPSGSHTRPRGGVLPHRIPYVHDTSSIQVKQPSTNQTPPRVQHKDPLATSYPNRLKTLCTPGTIIWAHRIATHRKHNTIGGQSGSAEPLVRLNRPCSRWSRPFTWHFPVGSQVHSMGAFGDPPWPSWPINRRGPSHFWNTPFSSSSSSPIFTLESRDLSCPVV